MLSFSQKLIFHNLIFLRWLFSSSISFSLCCPIFERAQLLATLFNINLLWNEYKSINPIVLNRNHVYVNRNQQNHAFGLRVYFFPFIQQIYSHFQCNISWSKSCVFFLKMIKWIHHEINDTFSRLKSLTRSIFLLFFVGSAEFIFYLF